MKKKRLLFFHFDLSGGGAEKVLVNLLNGLDKEKYDITLLLLFKQGENLKNLAPHITVQCVFSRGIKGSMHFLKLFSPSFLYKWFIKGKYDVEIAYIEYSPTRIIAGGKHPKTKRIAWVHSRGKKLHHIYRTKAEMRACYQQYDKIVFVSKEAEREFARQINEEDLPYTVLPNVIDVVSIERSSLEKPVEVFDREKINICAVGKLVEDKGVIRLAKAMCNLYQQGIRNWHLYYLGQGDKQEEIASIFVASGAGGNVTFLGYQDNPYKYMAQMSLFVCPSFSEGYSTATIEALTLHLPVLVTDCGGMREITADGKYGLLVENTDKALEEGLKAVLTQPDLLQKYQALAVERATIFSPRAVLDATECLIDNL